MVEKFPQEELTGMKVPSHWNDNLFEVHKKSPLLELSKAELFHTFMAQGLFACKRARPDIQIRVPLKSECPIKTIRQN